MSFSPGLLKILGIKISAQLVDSSRPPEQRLFQAIIVQAFEDALNSNPSKSESYYKIDAHNWFVNPTAVFDQICWLAGFDPEMITDRYQKLHDNGQVTFSKRQLAWVKYRNLYKEYRSIKDTEKRREIMGNIKKISFKS